MRAFTFLSLFLIAGLGAQDIAPPAATPAPEARLALVVGVTAYDSSDSSHFAPLSSPGRDATDMAATLKTTGFEVFGGKPLINPTRRQLLDAVDAYGDALRKGGGVGLFYFSGHGVQDEEGAANYIIPTGTQIRSVKDLPEEAVNVQRVVNRMSEAKNRLNLLFLDACRNNNLPRETKSSTAGLAAMRGASGLMVFFATQPNDIAFDNSEGTGSIFTRSLLEHLPKPGVSFMDMMSDVTGATEKLSLDLTKNNAKGPKKQSPFVSGTLSGRFYFVPDVGKNVSATPSTVSEQFFSQCGLGKFSLGYKNTTIQFRKLATLKYFEARVRDMELDKNPKLTWEEPDVANDGAQRRCKVWLESGKSLDLIVFLQREQDTWRIDKVHVIEGREEFDIFAFMCRSRDTLREGAEFAKRVEMEPPNQAEIRQLVTKSLIDFHAALQLNDFSKFYESLSERWKLRGMTSNQISEDSANEAGRVTVPKLHAAFKGFIEAKDSLYPIFENVRESEMVLNFPARINSDGVLLCEGILNTKPKRIEFKLEYYFESLNWKLFGVSIDLKK